MGAGTYRKRPIIAECMQLDDGITPHHEHLCSAQEVAEWCGGEVIADPEGGMPSVCVPTLHGDVPAHPGEWVIQGIIDFYPLKKHQFPDACDPVTPVEAGIVRLTREAIGNDLPVV